MAVEEPSFNAGSLFVRSAWKEAVLISNVLIIETRKLTASTHRTSC